MVEIVSFAGIFFQVGELPRSIGCGFGKNERLQVVASFVTVSTGVLMIEVLPFPTRTAKAKRERASLEKDLGKLLGP